MAASMPTTALRSRLICKGVSVKNSRYHAMDQPFKGKEGNRLSEKDRTSIVTGGARISSSPRNSTRKIVREPSGLERFIICRPAFR